MPIPVRWLGIVEFGLDVLSGVDHCFKSLALLSWEKILVSMSRRVKTIASALCVLAIGSPLVAGCTDPLATKSFNSGVEEYEQGDYQGAIKSFTKAIEINPQDADYYYVRGNSRFELKDFEGAAADYTKAIEINPRLASSYSNRGASKDYLGDYQGAISDFTTAIEINPQDADFYYNRGNSKGQLKDYQGAIADLDMVIKLNPQYADAYLTRGNAKEFVNDLAGACADWNKAADMGLKEPAEWVQNQC